MYKEQDASKLSSQREQGYIKRSRKNACFNRNKMVFWESGRRRLSKEPPEKWMEIKIKVLKCFEMKLNGRRKSLMSVWDE